MWWLVLAILLIGGPARADEISTRELLAILNERSTANGQRFDAQEKAVAAALAAAKEAVAKAEAAAEKRFEGLNEFRGTLKDQQATLMPRAEVLALLKSMDEKIQNNDGRISAIISRGEGGELANWPLGGAGRNGVRRGCGSLCRASARTGLMVSTFHMTCAAVVSFDDAAMFLLRIDPPDKRQSHMSGDMPLKILELEPGETYEVTVRKVDRPSD